MSISLPDLKAVVPPGYELSSAERFDLWTKLTELAPDEYHGHAQKLDRKGLWKIGLRFKYEEEIW